MLEDYTMDKKPNGRNLQVPIKSGTEVKNSDAPCKPFGRNNRRREPSSSNSKNDPLRRSANPAKGNKFTDKRPRPRSQYPGCGKSETKVDLEEGGLEYGSVFLPGSKKQNLNHLLKFTLAPRTSSGSSSSSGRFHKEKHGNWLATHKHKYNKEQFLQANCQFVVKADVDYSPYLVDPDILVDWNLIEQVRFRSTENISCPICLDTPVAAKMTRCGHVYCWPCILHYLALSDKTWRKCPICYEAVHKKDLKSVVVVSSLASQVGEEATFRLMKRERNSWMVIPVSEEDKHHSEAVPLSVNEPNLSIAYSKLLLAPAGKVQAMLDSERAELNGLLKASEGEPEICFIEQAVELLEERVRGELRTGELPAVEQEPDVKMEDQLSNEDEDGAAASLAVPEEETPSTEIDNSTIRESFSDEDLEVLQNVSPEDVETEGQISGQKPFYFYQAMDGQNVFLTALNLRMLETQYGGLQYCPLTITGRVLEKEAGSMTRELRSRLRSLSHLPVTAAFELLELDMQTLVSPDIMDAYAVPLSSRAERRHRRERQERRREKRITNEVAMQWGRRPTPRIRLDSARHFPRCGEEESISAEISLPANSNTRDSRSPSVSSVNSFGPDVEAPVLSQLPSLENTGPSFAQMLKAGASSSRPKPAWPTFRQAEVLESEDPDDHSHVPRFQHSFSEAIAQALEKADLNKDEEDTSTTTKKKKKKQKVLFASGMAFTSK